MTLGMDGAVSFASAPIWAAFGIGVAVASAPGPVQAILLGEAVRGGLRSGLQALAGVHLIFGSLLICLALGVSIASPNTLVVELLQCGGGLVLIWLGADGFRAAGQRAAAAEAADRGARLPPPVRGAMAVLVFPGTWLFLAGVASPLLAAAREPGGPVSAIVTALALVAGAALGDAAVVLAAGLVLAGRPPVMVVRVRQSLAVGLIGIGVVLLAAAAGGIAGSSRPT
jgi:threonine/homoserine/homoserine lactone efflux protein